MRKLSVLIFLFCFIRMTFGQTNADNVIDKNNKSYLGFYFNAGINKGFYPEGSYCSGLDCTTSLTKLYYSYSGGVSFLFKSPSKLKIGTSIGYAHIGIRDTWISESEELVLDHRVFTNLLLLRSSFNFINDSWTFSLEPGVAFYLNTKRIDFLNKTIDRRGNANGYFASPWYKYSPNIMGTVGRYVYKGDGLIKNVKVFASSEYHFATYFFNNSLGVSIEI